MTPSALQQRWQKLRVQLPYLPRVVRLVWGATRGWTLLWLLLLLVQGGLPGVVVYLTRWLVDSLVSVMGKGVLWATLQPLLWYGGWMAAALLLGEVLRIGGAAVRMVQTERVKDWIVEEIHQRSVSVDLAFYESPAYFDDLHRARQEAQFRPLLLLEQSGSVLQNSITLLSMLVILLPFGLWLPLLLLGSTLPAFYVVLRYSARYYRWRRDITEEERRAAYYDRLLTHQDTAAEVRLFALGEPFRQTYQAIRRRLRGEQFHLLREESLGQAAAVLFALLATGGALLWMVWRALQGQATLGQIALFYQAFQKGQGLLRVLLKNLGQIYGNLLFLSHLFAFLDLKPQLQSPPQPLPFPDPLTQGASFRGVSFAYPGSEEEALHDFHLEVPAGQMSALVGENGAGKSTLLKLLCRFYDPQQGQIQLDGHDLRDFSLETLRQKVTVLFQEPVHYSAPLRDNILFGDWRRQPSQEEIAGAVRLAGATQIVESLPQGYETLLGKWFEGGAELSVGEWQRIALARAFLRRAPLLLLDEPTSAMDSWSEASWMERLRTVAQGRTVLLITHRLSTAMRADIIHVMHRGQIVESGSHHQLLDLNGRYARSWTSQTQRFPNAPR